MSNRLLLSVAAVLIGVTIAAILTSHPQLALCSGTIGAAFALTVVRDTIDRVDDLTSILFDRKEPRR